MIVKGMLAGLQTFLLFFSTVAVAFAEEKHEAAGGYDSMAYVWFAMIGIIVVWGVYDSFFRPMD